MAKNLSSSNLLVVLLAALLVASCGGGGGSSGTASSASSESASSPASWSLPAPAWSPPSVPATNPGKICDQFYSPSFVLKAGETNEPLSTLSTLSKPNKAQIFPEPVYGTCLGRVTDSNDIPVVGPATPAGEGLVNDYSMRQAFNADSTKLLVYAINGGNWYLYDATTFNFIENLPLSGGDNEPQWDPTDPNLLYWLPTNGGLVVNQLDVSTNQNTVIGDFTTRVPAIWPTAQHVWTRSKGSPSYNRQYWAFKVGDANFNLLGFMVWDKVHDQIVSTFTPTTAADQVDPDWIGMSPSGNFVLVAWDAGAGPGDTEVFTPDFKNRFSLYSAGAEHGDIALDVNGDDVYVSIDYANTGDIYMRRLKDGVLVDLVPTYLDPSVSWTTALHISGKAFAKPGWALISTYGASSTNNEQQWIEKKVFALQLTYNQNPTIYEITHTFQVDSAVGADPSIGTYYTEPHASVNWDFTKVVWSSNWNVDSGINLDDYMVQLPAGAVK